MKSGDSEAVRFKYLSTDRDASLRTDDENMLCCLVEFENDVSNGGFSQYFYNTGGDTIDLLRQSLLAIGCLSVLETLERAIKVAKLDHVLEKVKGNDRMLHLADPLRTHDEKFYREYDEFYRRFRMYLEEHETPSESTAEEGP